jgi:hypothetical protein
MISYLIFYRIPSLPLRISTSTFLLIQSAMSTTTAISHVEEQTPLLRGLNRGLKSAARPSLNLQHWHSYTLLGDGSTVRNTREKVAHFLSSKPGHYSVLGLVTLDVLGIIAGRQLLVGSAILLIFNRFYFKSVQM